MAELDLLKRQLPYGGAVNIRGEVVWRVTEKEFKEMKAHIERIFNESGYRF